MSTEAGRLAEAMAADFLKNQGHAILAQNWRTRWCEIDVVTQQNNTIYFVEVKYRASNNWGGGLEYITASKLKQMHFAAEFWIARHKTSPNYRLAAIELTGTPPEVSDWLDDIY